MNTPIKVMLVDDSSTIRSRLRETINHEPDMEIVAEASDPFEAREPFRTAQPDLLVVDLVMPGMDGVAFLKKVMRFRPIPVVLFTSVATPEVIAAAMAAGAVSVVAKPSDNVDSFSSCIQELLDEIRFHARRTVGATPKGAENLIALGASTGGPEAIAKIVADLPLSLPPIVIALHMPANFTTAFAQRISHISHHQCMVATDGMLLRAGMIVIAPGDQHLLVSGRLGNWVTILSDDPPKNHHRPSVDLLFQSVATHVGKHALGVLLTGMGDDGAEGLAAMRQTGSITFAQDEQSSVVFGMPAEAIRRGGVEKVLSLSEMPVQMIRWAQSAQERKKDAPAHL